MIFHIYLKITVFIGLVSALSWIMLMLLPCLQCREIQQTLKNKALKRVKDLNLHGGFILVLASS